MTEAEHPCAAWDRGAAALEGRLTALEMDRDAFMQERQRSASVPTPALTGEAMKGALDAAVTTSQALQGVLAEVAALRAFLGPRGRAAVGQMVTSEIHGDEAALAERVARLAGFERRVHELVR